ncbi:MAG: preprotein translocase subunit SecG [Zestosphaera tikiterensis]|uniref:Preprotein translocase subunit SecG n=1 Tax=Zestosphaera tikiterensis TaxID=1973259 RepID=A0A2R7Y7L0_9CREN|nr:MAG: preprotein translocase subunit SecG [Zestosphaera tikiterensis]
MSSRRKRREVGPASGAGLVRFFEEVESKVGIKPYTIIWLSIAFATSVIILTYLTPYIIGKP